MSTSLPSKEIFAVDVPEVKNFQLQFKYNFFVPDEKVREVSGIPANLLRKSTGEIEADQIKHLETRVPRHVIFNWSKVHINEPGNRTLDVDTRARAFRSSGLKNYISQNYSKIVTEDHFSSHNFIGVTFHDGEIDKKAYNLVSGSYLQLTLSEETDTNVSPTMAAAKLNSITPQTIKPHFFYRSLAEPKLAYGGQQFVVSKSGNRSQADGPRIAHNEYMNRLKSAYLNAQINSKFLHNITSRNIKDPSSPFNVDLHSLNKLGKKLSTSMKHKIGHTITETEFKTIVPFINLKVDKTAHHQQRKPAEIVGYVIDKWEVSANGAVKQLEPIIIDNVDAQVAIDSRVKYDQQYCYSIRSVALFHIPAIDHETSEVATIQVLISSRSSNKLYVTVHDDVAPPPPADLKFNWNYEDDKLLVHWAFPPNSQRDIKKFQVFRRSSIEEPYELLKEYNFDDSVVKAQQREIIAPHLIENLSAPATYYVDDDFTKDSKYMYAVCSIDAHGLTSCYSAQFELSFDRFKNALQKKLMSHSGAPKSYPNMYLEGEGFVDVARVEGAYTKKLSVYFVPQYYQLTDERGRVHKMLSTKQAGGSYKINFLNVDNQKSETMTILIDDKIMKVEPKLSFPASKFNVQSKFK